MKTTIDLPNSTLEQAKTLADAQGISMEQLLANTIEEKLRNRFAVANGAEPPWMKGFGSLADLKDENARVLRIIEDEFENIEPEDRP